MVWQPRNDPKNVKKAKDFEDWYLLAKEYYETEGNLLVPESYISPDGSKLGRWIERMRAAYNGKINKSLTLTEIAMLEKIEMVWRLEKRFPFEAWILQCKLYRAAHGDLLVPRSYVNADYALGEWIAEQRKLKKRGKLDEKRVLALESECMVWEAVDKSLWMRTYECSQNYLTTHADIPKSYQTEEGVFLRDWLIQQKSNYRPEVCDTKGDFEKHELLSRIGVTWNDEPRKPARGYEYAARQYFIEHGNLNVPEGFLTEDGLDLYAWVKKLWVTYHWPRNSKRKQELEKLGFDWSPDGKWDWDPKEKQWLENFIEVKQFKETNGFLPIKEHSIMLSSGIDSGNWIKYNLQRKLAPEKKALLYSIGIKRCVR